MAVARCEKEEGIARLTGQLSQNVENKDHRLQQQPSNTEADTTSTTFIFLRNNRSHILHTLEIQKLLPYDAPFHPVEGHDKSFSGI